MRPGRSARRVDRLAGGADRHQAAPGRLEGRRSGAPQPRRAAVEALPRRLRPLLRALRLAAPDRRAAARRAARGRRPGSSRRSPPSVAAGTLPGGRRRDGPGSVDAVAERRRPVAARRGTALRARFDAALHAVVGAAGEAFAGSRFDVSAQVARRTALCEEVETAVAGPSKPSEAGSSPAATLAALLRESLAANTIGGRVNEDSKLRVVGRQGAARAAAVARPRTGLRRGRGRARVALPSRRAPLLRSAPRAAARAGGRAARPGGPPRHGGGAPGRSARRSPRPRRPGRPGTAPGRTAARPRPDGDRAARSAARQQLTKHAAAPAARRRRRCLKLAMPLHGADGLSSDRGAAQWACARARVLSAAALPGRCSRAGRLRRTAAGGRTLRSRARPSRTAASTSARSLLDQRARRRTRRSRAPRARCRP